MNEPLGFPGSSRLRLEGHVASDLRILHQNIQAHGGTLFTYPRMLSLNLWTGRRPPVLPPGVPDAQDRALLGQLETDPRAVFVVNHYWIELTLLRRRPLPATVFSYLNEHFAPVLQIDSFELWVHRGRTVAPFSIARLLPAAIPGRPQLELTLEALAHLLAAIEFVELNPEHGILQRLSMDVAQPWQRISISESGSVIGEVAEGTGSVSIPRASRLTLPFALAPDWPSLNHIGVRLLGADGRILGRLRFADKPSVLPVTDDQEVRGER